MAQIFDLSFGPVARSSVNCNPGLAHQQRVIHSPRRCGSQQIHSAAPTEDSNSHFSFRGKLEGARVGRTTPRVWEEEQKFTCSLRL